MKDDHDYRTLKIQINFDLGTIFDKRESRIQIQKGMKIKNTRFLCVFYTEVGLKA